MTLKLDVGSSYILSVIFLVLFLGALDYILFCN